MTPEHVHNKGVGKVKYKGFGLDVLSAAGKKPFKAKPGGTLKATGKAPSKTATNQQNKPEAGKGRKT